MIGQGDGVAGRVLAAAGVDRDAVLRTLPPVPRVDAAGRESGG
jgi:Clp amino terminal domain, pathogenicity island component